jgi:carbonic anhydrase
MSATDELLKANQAYADGFDQRKLPAAPARKLAVVACMDARLDPARALGLQEGDAHVIRNAGGVVGDEEIRSLAISQYLLGTEEVVLIHHTGCGMLGIDEDALARRIKSDTGRRPDFDLRGFADLEESLRESIRKVTESPFLPHRESVRGFVYEVETGRLREVR